MHRAVVWCISAFGLHAPYLLARCYLFWEYLFIDPTLHTATTIADIGISITKTHHVPLCFSYCREAGVRMWREPIGWTGSFVLIFHTSTVAAKLARTLVNACSVDRRDHFHVVRHIISYALYLLECARNDYETAPVA